MITIVRGVVVAIVVNQVKNKENKENINLILKNLDLLLILDLDQDQTLRVSQLLNQDLFQNPNRNHQIQVLSDYNGKRKDNKIKLRLFFFLNL